MPGLSFHTRIIATLVISMLLAIPFPAQIATAGTIWHEGPAEFANGTSENIVTDAEGLVLSKEYNIKDWVNMNPSTAPPARIAFAMAYDSTHSEVVLFGGYLNGTVLNDTWTYNLTINKWANMNPPTAPDPRCFGLMVYDNESGEMVLYGGDNGTEYGFFDTWTYNLTENAWTEIYTSDTPWQRQYSAMVFDNVHCEAVIFGGSGPSRLLGDTWTFNLTARNWINMYPATAPSPRDCHAMAFDDAHGEVVLYGGCGSWDQPGETWTYNFSKNIWTNMSPPTAPLFKEMPSMVYDHVLGEEVLFGGFNISTRSNETWTYDLTTNIWTKRDPPDTPPGGGGYGMVYDTASDKVILFGGKDYSNNETWAYDHKTIFHSGIFTSNPHDTGGTAYFGTISWDADVSLNTSLRFQFRSADSKENLTTHDFFGPDGTVDSFYEISGQQINSVDNGSRWFQYQAHLGTDNSTVTPRLHLVTVKYNLLHSVRFISPLGGENWTGPQNIIWSASDLDNDSLSFDIFLENATVSVPLTLDLPDGMSSFQWNASIVPNGIYRVRIVANDDNPSIPLTVSAVSGSFTVYHLPPPQPPNHPPHVWLVSPLNNTILNTNVIRLAWIGTDPDNDHLTYTAHYSEKPLYNGPVYDNVTTSEYLDMTNLPDNTTYYWTVDANDGINNHTDGPAEVWTFTVKLPHPPVNHPPKITSLPPTEVMVGDELNYNMTAADVDGDTLVYSLAASPPNMSIDSSSGKVRWTPSADEIGNHTVVVHVSDGRGGVDIQTFTVKVTPKPIPPVPEKPQCTIVYPLNGSKVSGRIQIRGTAINGTLPLTTIQIRIDVGNWTTAIGLKNWTLTVNSGQMKNGRHTIEARAFDGSLYSETASIELTITNTRPKVTLEASPLYLLLIVILAMVGVGAYMTYRLKSKPYNKT